MLVIMKTHNYLYRFCLKQLEFRMLQVKVTTKLKGPTWSGNFILSSATLLWNLPKDCLHPLWGGKIKLQMELR